LGRSINCERSFKIS